MKTKFDSYCINDVTDGCKYCVKGEKLVLFITGKCSRSCEYCSLSNKRKNKDIIWANERLIKNSKYLIQEVKESNAKGAGITGGDPLLVLERTVKFIKLLKKHFGRRFHIHIYLPTDKVNENNLKQLYNSGIDEIRFHPRNIKDLEKVKLASKFWDKSNIGIELPLLPEKYKEIIQLIKNSEGFIGFVNLNELEISDTNFNFITKNYKMNEDTYTVKSSKETGLKILNYFKNSKLKIHLCTARTKNLFQYKNRLKLHKILPYGYKTKEGTVKYFVMSIKRINEKGYFVDKKNKRIILSEKLANKLQRKYKIRLVEELPTFDSTEIQSEDI